MDRTTSFRAVRGAALGVIAALAVLGASIPATPARADEQPPAKTTPTAGNAQLPDLVVSPIDYGYVGPKTVAIRNQGKGTAGHFRVAVLAGQFSYSFSVNGLAGGSHHMHSLSSIPCGQAVAILVDADHTVAEAVETNNSAGFTIKCPPGQK